MHLAARLREQLNSVIFETKSRIPSLESEITNRDQEIDGLREQLAETSKNVETSNNQQGSKEQEKQIDDLRQQVIDLETELRGLKSAGDEEAIFEIDEADRAQPEETELMADDEFLTDIQDIFEDGDNLDNSSGEPKTEANADPKKNIEEELQNELEGWDKSENDKPQEHTVAPNPEDATNNKDAKSAKPPGRAGRADLKEELLGLEDEFREGDDAAKPVDLNDIDSLRSEVEDLTKARKSLNEVVDSQAKEVAGLKNQRDLQDKSLNVLNQQLELARMANERILRELRELKDRKPSSPDAPRSATGS